MKRLPAEWEKQEFAMICFPHFQSDWVYCLDEITETYIQIVTKISLYQKCLIICDDISRVKSILKNANALNKNIFLIQIKTNDTWIRDYGCIDMIDKDKIISYDFIFNGWGLKFDAFLDNKFNKKLYEKQILNTFLIKKDFVLEGGSIDTNGKGVLLTTKKCLLEKNRNPALSQESIELFLTNNFNLNKIIWLEHGYLKGDDTDSHIDTLARFIDEKTIVYAKCEDANDEHFEELQNMEKELKNSGFSTIALPLPSPIYFKGKRLPATYINFLFINGAVLVPQYNDEKDKEILDFFKSFYINLDIIPIDSTILIREHGSIHCATMNRWAKLRI